MITLGPGDYRQMPWKNGGGTTLELHVANPGRGGYDWRVSIATVARNGPFSIFEGYDRSIMLIEGNGMVLTGGPDGPMAVAPRYSPRRFAGEWKVRGKLIDGPVRDFNLIGKRSAVATVLTCQTFQNSCVFGDEKGQTFLHVLDGEAKLQGASLAAGASVLLDPGEAMEVSPSAGSVTLAVCRVLPLA